MILRGSTKPPFRGIKRKGGIKRQSRTSAKKSLKKPKEKSISKLIKECDRLFSIQVRSIGAEGLVDFDRNWCFTCGKQFPIKKLHCGHYVSRWYKAARWDFDNCRPQCPMCNLWRKGDSVRFRQNLIKEIGVERVEAVEALRDQPTKLSREYLTTLLEELQG